MIASLSLLALALAQGAKPHGYGAHVAEIDSRELPTSFLSSIGSDAADDDGPGDMLVLVWYATDPAGTEMVVEIVSVGLGRTLWHRDHDRAAQQCDVVPWWTDTDSGYLLVDEAARVFEAFSFSSGLLATRRFEGEFVAALPPTPGGRTLIVAGPTTTRLAHFGGETWTARSISGGGAGRLPVVSSGESASSAESVATFDDAPDGGLSFRLIRTAPARASERPSTGSFDARHWERSALARGDAALLRGADWLQLCLWDVVQGGGCGEVTLHSWRTEDGAWVEGERRYVAFEGPAGDSNCVARVTGVRTACVPWFPQTLGGLGARFFGAALAPNGRPPGFLLAVAHEDATWLTFVTVGPGSPRATWSRFVFSSNVGESINGDDRDWWITLGVAPSCASGYSEHSGVFVVDVTTGESVAELRRRDVADESEGR